MHDNICATLIVLGWVKIHYTNEEQISVLTNKALGYRMFVFNRVCKFKNPNTVIARMYFTPPNSNAKVYSLSKIKREYKEFHTDIDTIKYVTERS